MRVVLCVALIALSCTLTVPAHAGRLQIFSDAALTECALADASPGVVNIYVADSGSDGYTGSRFRIVAGSGFTGVWVGETSPFVTIGTSPTDVSIGYGYCAVGTFLVLKMAYQLFGTSTCSTLSVAPAVGFPVPICTHCSFGEYPCNGFDDLYVNCSGNCGPVATESTTWGQVKALYRN